jgi:flagellar hook-basal body complex protein FliE
MTDIGIDAVLQQIHTLSAEVKNAPLKTAETETQFSNLLKQSIDKVNNLQQQSGNLVEAFERGEENVSLAQVMIAKEKSGLAFQALTQARNHMLTAYKDIMNMPV